MRGPICERIRPHTRVGKISDCKSSGPALESKEQGSFPGRLSLTIAYVPRHLGSIGCSLPTLIAPVAAEAAITPNAFRLTLANSRMPPRKVLWPPASYLLDRLSD